MKTDSYVEVSYDVLKKNWKVDLVIGVNGEFTGSLVLAELEAELQAQYFAELVEQGYTPNEVWDLFNEQRAVV